MCVSVCLSWHLHSALLQCHANQMFGPPGFLGKPLRLEKTCHIWMTWPAGRHTCQAQRQKMLWAALPVFKVARSNVIQTNVASGKHFAFGPWLLNRSQNHLESQNNPEVGNVCQIPGLLRKNRHHEPTVSGTRNSLLLWSAVCFCLLLGVSFTAIPDAECDQGCMSAWLPNLHCQASWKSQALC